MKIECLDHGYVRLVSYMQPAPEVHATSTDVEEGFISETRKAQPRGWTGDLEIVRNARVSHNADWRGKPSTQELKEGLKFLDSIPVTSDEQARIYAQRRQEAQESKDEKLIHYLYSHRHTTPFESMVFTFEVQAPIFVFRQWHRHRTWSYNEVSARYTELPELYYVPDATNIGPQSKTNKQGREEGFTLDAQLQFKQGIEWSCQNAFRVYHSLLKAGVSRELARMVLPLNTYSRMFATVDLHNLFHFLALRLDEHAQYEIRVYAQALLTLVRSVCPIAVEAFEKKSLPEIPS
jgi:thymidylate synthase (FAD)